MRRKEESSNAYVYIGGVISILILIFYFYAIVQDAMAGNIAWVLVDIVIPVIPPVRGFLMAIGVI